MACGAYTVSIYGLEIPRERRGIIAARAAPPSPPLRVPRRQVRELCGVAAAPRRLLSRTAEAHVAQVAGVAGAVTGQRAARCRRKSASSRVGRPVLPFCAPPWEAVPATSRCGH